MQIIKFASQKSQLLRKCNEQLSAPYISWCKLHENCQLYVNLTINFKIFLSVADNCCVKNAKRQKKNLNEIEMQINFIKNRAAWCPDDQVPY